MWGRLSPHPRLDVEAEGDRPGRIVPTSAAPLALFPREEATWLLTAFGPADSRDDRYCAPALSSVASALFTYLRTHGASFFADLTRGTGHLPSEVESGLWELVAAGLVTADGFDNLRALLDPRRRRAEGRERARRPRYGAGRWSLLRPLMSPQPQPVPVERIARQLLQRYGVVFRDLLARESFSPAWRDLLIQYRRMELRGEIRGGRFVDGFTGEQYGLPEAVESIRALRRAGREASSAQEIRISAADPLNLAGVILPGPRVTAVAGNYLVFREGVVVRSGSRRDAEPEDLRIAKDTAIRRI